MKITIVQGPYFPIPPLLESGVEKMWHGLGQEFARRGHDVTHISRRFDGLPNEEVREGVHHLRVPSRDAPRAKWHYRAYDLVYSLRARTRLPRGADVLITNCMWLPILIRDSRFGRLYVHVARFPKGQMFLYRHAARLQTVSSVVAARIERETRGAKKVSVVPPYLTNFDERFEPAFAGRPREILYVGRIHPEKGIHLLAAAFARLPDDNARLTIVGSHDHRHGGGGEAYRASLVETLGAAAARVSFAGLVEQARLNSFFDRAALLVYPSIAETGESFGVVPLEGMARGCPAVVSDLACFRDYLAPGKNGLIFDHRAADAVTALRDTIARVLNDEPYRMQLARNGHATACQYSLANAAGRFLSDFEQLLATKGDES